MFSLPTFLLIAVIVSGGDSSHRGTLSGQATDAAGRGVASAIALISVPQEGPEIKTKTTTDGQFRLVRLQTGTYKVCLTSPGFKTTCVDSVTISHRRETKLGNITLGLEQCCGGISITRQSIGIEQKPLETTIPSVEPKSPKP
jgi:hypothetical protein